MKSQTSQKIIKDIAKHKHLKEDAIMEILRSQFRKVKLTLEEMNKNEGYFPIIQLPNWGKYFVTEKKKRK
jgi:nucleoid DNA-binding protein